MALNMHGTYYHVDIHPAHRYFLRFMVGHSHFQYRVLTFGLSTTPRKVFSVVAAHLIFPYLNDWLLAA